MIKKANIAYKYRIFPDENQEILFAKTFGCCRKIWNLMLGDINKAYKDEHKKLKPTPAQYKKQFPYLKEVDSLALANVQMNARESAPISFLISSSSERWVNSVDIRSSRVAGNQEDPTQPTIRTVQLLLEVTLSDFQKLAK